MAKEETGKPVLRQCLAGGQPPVSVATPAECLLRAGHSTRTTFRLSRSLQQADQEDILIFSIL